ncbi:ATP-binding cassette domain-containing protein [Paracoccus solventivorans]|uniref:ABC transporter ATP-binding protein n=1 Tax=Paracoccus solventivorans TaxID=53463 RepID=UPI0026EEE8D8|nr:ABC transporter ATP-binding protein [Paracoccus solventivorans]
MSATAAPAGTDPLVVENLSWGERFPRCSLTVAPGECVVLTGPSGSGKSRLLRLIADLDPGSGTARIGSLVREAVPANHWRRLVVYVPADSGWWASRVALHMSDEARARRLFPDLALPDKLMDAAPDEVSSGERQRLALIRALILQPHFLLLDEPTSALDPVATLMVEKVLTRAKQDGTGLLVVSHDPEQVARIADRHYALSDCGLAEVVP